MARVTSLKSLPSLVASSKSVDKSRFRLRAFGVFGFRAAHGLRFALPLAVVFRAVDAFVRSPERGACSSTAGESANTPVSSRTKEPVGCAFSLSHGVDIARVVYLGVADESSNGATSRTNDGYN